MVHRFLGTLFFVVFVAFQASAGNAGTGRPWVPEHYSIPDYTLSPDGRYGVMLPDDDMEWPNGANKLVEMNSGKVVVVLEGVIGWDDPLHLHRSMRYDPMKAVWSADGSALCWIHPGRWNPDSFVVLKMIDAKVSWQVDIMKALRSEILARTQAAAPQHFAAAKLANKGYGSAYPEGFTIDASIPDTGFSFPLVCNITLNSFPNAAEPEQIKLKSSLVATIHEDKSISYSNFAVERGTLWPEDMKKLAEPKERFPLVDTDLGKVIPFTDMTSPDGRYAVGWTVRPAEKGIKPVEWSRWVVDNPDKLLRNYDWQDYSRKDQAKPPYEVVDLMIDLHTGKTAMLSSTMPHWQGKRGGWNMKVAWTSGPHGNGCALINNSDSEGLRTGNFWLVRVDETGMHELDMALPMRAAINVVLRDLRPVVPDPAQYMVTYELPAWKASGKRYDFAEIPFVAKPNGSWMRGWGLNGVVTLNLSDGSVKQVSTDAKRIDPLVTNRELRKANDRLNTAFQKVLKQLPPEEVAAFEQKQREWTSKRDDNASTAALQMPYQASEEACEQAREKSLLEVTKTRVEELEKM